MKQIRKGIYPTMITTFTEDNQVDYAGLEALLEYYAKSRCDGIFALCLSSEIFQLSDREMQQIMRFISKNRPDNMSLIASAHTSPDVEAGIRQLSSMLENGADEPVLILNRLAMACESEDVVRRNAERIFEALPDVTFGIYECPYPYKRMVSDELLRWFAQTGRIGFLKDTCCDEQRIRRRLQIVNGTGLQLFNANTATLLASLRDGGCGFSGVMANFHADLYATLYRFHLSNDSRANILQACAAPRFKKIVQTITYAPHFISTVIVVGMINLFFSPSTGVFTIVLQKLGLLEGNLNVLLSEGSFRHLYVWSGVWSNIGWNSIVYLSALSGVDPALHEAAIVDGANKLQRCRHIDLPCIVPTIIMLLILRMGNLMDVGFQKAYLMQNSMNLNVSEVLSTYVYKQGMQKVQYSYSTAIDLFNSAINFVLLISVNTISRKVSETSLW